MYSNALPISIRGKTVGSYGWLPIWHAAQLSCGGVRQVEALDWLG